MRNLFDKYPHLEEKWSFSGNDVDPRVDDIKTTNRYVWDCPKGHTWTALLNNVARGSGCGVCRGFQVLPGLNDIMTTNPELAEAWDYDLNDLGPESYTEASSKKVWWKCDKGHSWLASISNRKNGRGCSYCSGKKVLPGFNDIFTIHPELQEWWSKDNDIDPKSLSIGTHTEALWECPEGHVWSEVPINLISGRRCPYCSGHRVLQGFNDIRTTHPGAASRWDYTKNGDLTPDRVSFGSNIKAWWKCSRGHSWFANVYRVVSSALEGCPYCANLRVDKDNSLYSTHYHLIPEWDHEKNTISPKEITAGSDVKVWWRCVKGHEWESLVYSRTSKTPTGCRKCSTPYSTAEREILAYIQELLTDVEVIHNDRKVLSGKELDIYIPSLGIAFEYNGLYYHSTAPSVGNVFPTAQKMDMCDDLGIDLYVVWEDDWVLRRDIVRKWISNLLGVSSTEKIGARKCSVDSTVTAQEAAVFLDSYHIQGDRRGSIRVGLRYREELIAIAVYSRNGDNLYLDRYATSASVPGGFTRIQKWIDSNVDYGTMVTFADKCYSKGKLYENNGWELDKVLRPDYSYLRNSQRVHKFNFRKANIKKKVDRGELSVYDANMTEEELTVANKVYRVYDCGKLRYTREKHTMMNEEE